MSEDAMNMLVTGYNEIKLVLPGRLVLCWLDFIILEVEYRPLQENNLT